MAHVLVIGASKGIGLVTTKAALAAGHRVRAFARSAAGIGLPDPSLERFTGDAVNAADVAAALDGVDVVVQALGVPTRDLIRPVRLFSEATNLLVPAMETAGVKRLIAVTGFGAGDSGMRSDFSSNCHSVWCSDAPTTTRTRRRCASAGAA